MRDTKDNTDLHFTLAKYMIFSKTNMYIVYSTIFSFFCQHIIAVAIFQFACK